MRTAASNAEAMRAALAPNGSEQALEFGCGTGLATLQLAPHLTHITAIDSSTAMLDTLRRKCESEQLRNVTALEDNVPDQLPDGRYDPIVSSMTLHHVEDTARVLGTLFEHLKPGGRVALADLDAEDGSFHGDKPGIAHHGFKRDAFEQLLTYAGFASIRLSTAQTMQREADAGQTLDFTLFLAVASRPETAAS